MKLLCAIVLAEIYTRVLLWIWWCDLKTDLKDLHHDCRAKLQVICSMLHLNRLLQVPIICTVFEYCHARCCTSTDCSRCQSFVLYLNNVISFWLLWLVTDMPTRWYTVYLDWTPIFYSGFVSHGNSSDQPRWNLECSEFHLGWGIVE